MTDHPHIHDDGLSPAARTALGDLQLPTAGVAPNPTGRMLMEMNLDSREGVAAFRERREPNFNSWLP